MLSLARRADRLASALLLVYLLVLASAADVAPALGQTESADSTAVSASRSDSTARENEATAPITPESWQLWDESQQNESWSTEGTSPLWVAGRVMVAVLLVASLVILLMLLVRRYGLGRGASGVGAPRLQLLASLSLAPRRTVYLVRVDGVELLVGTAGDGLRLLTELPGTREAALPGFSGRSTDPAAVREQTAAIGTATMGTATMAAATPPAPPSPAGDVAETNTFLTAFSNLLGFNPPAFDPSATPEANAPGNVVRDR